MAETQDGRQLVLTTPLGKDHLLIQRMTAREELSRLFFYELEIWHEETSSNWTPTIVDPKKILGQSVTVSISQREDAGKVKRYFNGIVNQFSQGQRDKEFTYYKATVVPAVWLLTQNVQSRIFQNKNVPDILKEVFANFNMGWQLQGTFEPRNYCVQYRESDFDFASRLMEEEGIYYFFEHSNGSHKMIVANTPQSHTDCPNKKTLEFNDDAETKDDFVSAVETWYVDHNLRTGLYTLWDDKFELPGKNLEAQKPAVNKFNGINDALEIYDYPGGYAKRFDGVDKGQGERPADINKIYQDNARTVALRMQEIDAQYKQIKGSSDCASFTAGHRFELKNHPTAENNAQHTLVSVTHELKQSPAYKTDDTTSDGYQNQFICIPLSVPFRPPRITPKPFVRGGQTAFVVGPPGEEIYPDKYGRVKVKFHWDRAEAVNADSSCWVRVAQSWASKQWGSMYIPRVGMEVVVDFLEGDPDQPIITGCVYNAESMPPYKLPDEMTKSGIKTNSTKGGGGFNELRFEDKKGSEQIFIHGEKDKDTRIKNDERHWIGNDHHFMVKRDRREQIERDEHRIIKRDQIEKIERDLHLKIEGKDATEIGGSLSLKVGGNVAEKFGANHSEETSGSVYIKAGATLVLEAGAGITLKVGGNFVTINPAGVQIQGTMVMINSGGAALAGSPGTIVPPMKPQVADPADDAKPGSKWVLEKRSAARKEKTFKQNTGAGGAGGADDKDKDKTHFIKIKLVDEAGKPVPGEAYKITLPDGSVTTGSLDEKGEAEVTGIDAGNCKVTFPNLDKDAWEDS